MNKILQLILACLFTLQIVGLAQPIVVDSSFGTAGIASFELKYTFPQAIAARLQPDGKILALAYLRHNANPTDIDEISLVRYMPDGALDNTFGADGSVVLSWGGNDFPVDLQIQPDGKILVAGTGGTANASIIARYNADGSIDPSFGTAGKTSFQLIPPRMRMNIQSDGKIDIAAFDGYGNFTQLNMARARLLPDGTIDESFGDSGFILTLDNTQHFIVDLNWDENGRLITAGDINHNPVFNRYDYDGNLDLTFGNNGSMLIPSGSGIQSFLIMDDGKLVFVNNFDSFEPVVMRLLPDGAPDTSFGSNGEVNLTDWLFLYEFPFTAQKWGIQPDGSIVMLSNNYYAFRILPNGNLDTSLEGIYMESNNPNYRSVELLCLPNGKITVLGDNICDLVMNQFLPNGNPDASFNGTGEVHTAIRSPFSKDYFASLAVQSDGKIVFCGYNTVTLLSLYYPYYPNYKNTIIRTHADGSMDTSFANAGIYHETDCDLSIQKISIQPDGKILVIGWNPRAEHTTILRLDTQGQLDSTFGQNGKVYYYFQLINAGYSIAFLNNGQFIIAGTNTPFNPPASFLTKFNSDGTPDPGFGINGRIYSPVQTNGSYYQAILALPNGKLLTIGQYSNNGNFLVLARYNMEEGALDMTFGTNGQVVYPVNAVGGAGLSLNRLMLQSDGKIVVSRGKSTPTISISLCRFNANGSIDMTFGENGVKTLPSELGYIHDLKQEESGKLVFLSSSYDEESNQYSAYCARMNTNGDMDDTYGENGATIFSTLSFPGYRRFLQGGDILATHILPAGDLGLIRYKSDLSVGVTALSKSLPQLWVYPNPVDDTSVIEFELREAEILSAELYDMAGKKVNILASPQRFDAGTHQIALRMGQLPRGSYVLVLSSGKWHTAGRIVY